MTNRTELTKTVNELLELEEMAVELNKEIESLRDLIKAEMLKNDVEEMTVDTHIIRWTSVLSNRFDSTAFKKVMPEVYKAYTKQISSKRFTIA